MDKMLPCKLFSAENMWDAGLILRCHKKLSNAECVRCSRGANPKKISMRFACILQNNVQVREGTYLMDMRRKGKSYQLLAKENLTKKEVIRK